MPITTGSFSKALWPGVNKWYGRAYNDYPVEHTALFDTYTSRKAFEEDISISSFGLATIKSEGGSVAYDTEQQGYITRYNHTVYALGFTITREAYEDDLYDVMGKRKATALARSIRQTSETNAANVYNRAFNSSYTGGDGKELLATDHPNVAGGTYANELSSAADLSETSLEQAYIDIAKLTDDRGLKIALRIKSLIIPVDYTFDAERILESKLRFDSANNDINALNSMGTIPKVVTNHYLTDTDAWFLRTDCDEGMKHFVRRSMEFSMDNEFNTENAMYKATIRESWGWSDPRSLFGSPGA